MLANVTMDTPISPRSSRGVSARDFFRAAIPGGTMTAAHYATKISYTTIHRAASGAAVSPTTAKALERWSRELGADLVISAALTLGLDAEVL